jgi:multicomponent Na+:H+ antiporter subunit D
MSDTVVSIRPLLAVLVSVLGAFLVAASGRRPNLRESWTIAAGVVKFLLIASMIPWVLDGKRVVWTVSTLWPGLDIGFAVDPLGLLFGLTASLLWVVTSFYSIGYMRGLAEHAQTRYFTCFAVALSATIGLAFSANLLTLFIFYELITFSTYPLVAHKETKEALAGANKYLAYLVGSSKAFFLAAVLLIWTLTGTTDFVPGGVVEGAGAGPRGLLVAAFLLFLFGVAKTAVMPLHSWLPSAMVAPTPVSALLHAVAVVKAGVFTMVRVMLFIFGPAGMRDLGLEGWTVAIASFTMITASLLALGRDNLKARLAYSTVSQLSYVILGAALVSPLANLGAVLHITIHAFSKITLFFCAGAIYVAAHKTEISQFSGLGRRMPWTMGAFAVGALSMIGVPPTAGFISKWYLALGSLEAGQTAVLAVILTSTMLNAAYFLPILYKAFFEPLPPGETAEIHEAPLFMLLPLLFTALVTLLLGCRPDLLLTLARRVVG